METDYHVTGISRFGRLRKISTKLIDLPTWPQNTERSKSKRCSSSIRTDLPYKSQSAAAVDPFVDFRPEMFDGLQPTDESTETSSSVGDEVGDKDENGKSRSKRKRCSSSIRKDLPDKSQSTAAVDPFVDFRPEMFDGLLPTDESTETSSSVGDEVGDNDEIGKPRKGAVSDAKVIEKKREKTIKTVARTRKRRRNKRRTTGYFIWAKRNRSKIKAEQPDMSSASVSRKLAEMWTKVSLTEKYNLKRTAERINSKIEKKTAPICENITPIETVWLFSKY